MGFTPRLCPQSQVRDVSLHAPQGAHTDSSHRGQRMAIVASLKAAQIAENLNLMATSVTAASTRVLVQNAIEQYNSGNLSVANSSDIEDDLKAGLQGGQQTALLLQAVIFPNVGSGPARFAPLYNATGDGVSGVIQLPYSYPNGTPVKLGDEGLGYPPDLYPNFTLASTPGSNSQIAMYNGQVVDQTSSLLLGPLPINTTFSLISITEPIINVNTTNEILGWLSVVIDARLVLQVLDSPIGLDETGIAFLIGPDNSTNHFPPGVLYSSSPTATSASTNLRFVLPVNSSDANRHPDHAFGSQNPSFSASTFPAIESALSVNQHTTMNAGSVISAKNEDGQSVSVAFATPGTPLCDWVLVIEQSRSEIFAVTNRLRTVLLACVFGTVG